jgi:hypothetical protein
MEMNGQLQGSAALTQGNIPRYPFDRRLGEENRISFRPFRVSKIGRPVRSMVTVLTELPHKTRVYFIHLECLCNVRQGNLKTKDCSMDSLVPKNGGGRDENITKS